MGNRAVISFNKNPNGPSIYLHWNGGRASVEGFMAGCLAGGYKSTGDAEQDIQFIARAIAPYFIQNGETRRLTVYEQPLCRADKNNGDNGWYVIDQKTLEIKGREFSGYCEEINSEKTAEISEIITKILTKPACRYEHIFGA
jgi:hypothetical protein